MKKSKPFFEGVSRYFGRLRLEMKSDATIEAYRAGLESFRDHLVSLGFAPTKYGWADLTADSVRAYLKWLVEAGHSLATRNLRLNALKSYIRFSAEEDIELMTQAIDVSKIKSKRTCVEKGKWMSRTQVDLLLEQTDRSHIGVRDHCILNFMLSTGVRLDELIKLKVSSVRLGKEPYVRVVGKGGKARIIPLPDCVASELRKYIGDSSDPDRPLFYCKAHGQLTQMSPDNIQRVVAKYSKKAKQADPLFPDISPHSLRHTYAALLNRSGIDIVKISLLLGHSSIETTEIYAETDAKMVEQAIKSLERPNEKRASEALSREERDLLQKLTGKACYADSFNSK